MTTLSQPTLSLPRLRAELGGEVIGPHDAGYDAARVVHRRTIDRRPAAIVRPVDADEVATVVSIARETGVELAVRSGAHSLAGHGVTDRGIVLDLSAMKSLQIDWESRMAWVETGLTAGEATRALGAYGLAIPFGEAASVGVGGLTLGGGIGFLVRKHGLTIDSVVAVELVTADGELRYVDADEEPDLFWAIRGGGGNFGVATSFCFRLRPIAAVTGGMLALPATPSTIASLVEAASGAPDELSTIAAVVAVLIDMVRSQPYPDLGTEPQGPPIAATNTMFLDAVDEDVAASILDHLRASTAQVAAVQLRALGGAVARVPSDATAFARQGEPGTYVNFVGDEGAARVREAYPGRTGERPAAIKREYDPENLFRLNQNIEPARE